MQDPTNQSLKTIDGAKKDEFRIHPDVSPAFEKWEGN